MKKLSRGLISVLLAAALMLSMCAVASAAVLQPEGMTLVSDKETLLAPGIVQNEAVAYTANNDRLSYYAATIDLSNPTNHLIANYKDNQTQEFGMQTVTDQIDATEAKHQGENFRIVVATNSSYYNMTTGRPRGAFIMNGVDNTLENVALVDPVTGGTKRDAEGNIVYGSEGDNFGFFAIKKDGTPMLGYIGEFSQYRDQLQEACATHGVLVRNGENVVSPTINQAKAPETLVGLTADNKVVLLVCDGRQAPYSIGINFYEGANLMLSMGCVNACALDGGGSSTYVCRRPGAEDYQVVNRPSDGAPRSVSNTIMVYSTAAPTGVVQSADVISDYDYLSPGSSVNLSANGVDICGYPAELPEGVYFTLSDDSMGSINGDVFTAGSAYGDVTVNCMYDGKLLGSHELHIIRPESIAWTKSVIVATYGERTALPIVAYYQGEFVSINGGDLITLCGPIEELVDQPETYGYVDGLEYVAPDERCGIRSAPIYAMLAWDTETGDTIIQSKIELHRASESVFDFDTATVNHSYYAYNRDITNTYTEDNVNYYIQNSQDNVEISYTMAINLEEMQLPEDLQPLWDAFGEGLGGTIWGGFLRIANKIDDYSNVTAKLDFPDSMIIKDTSEITFSCPLFDVDRDSVTIDPETNTLIIPLLWNKSYVQSVILETGSIDPVDVDPIGVLSGLKAVLSEDVDFGESERLPESVSAVVEYKMIALSSSAYGAAEKNEELNKYMYIDPKSNRPGICVFGEYINTTDSFVLHSQILDGWDSAGTSYTVNGVKLKGAQVIDGSVYYFDENGILDSGNAYSGMIKGLDGKLYYALSGKLESGWVFDDGQYYYFNPATKEAVDGEQKIDGFHYRFKDNCLVHGELVSFNDGDYKLMWAGKYVTMKWIEMDDGTYYVDSNQIVQRGLSVVLSSVGSVSYAYRFDDNGRLIEKIEEDGVYVDENKGACVVKNGTASAPNLIKADNGCYYFISTGRFSARNATITLTEAQTNGLVPAGTYSFGSDGKMLNPPDELKNGMITEEGVTRYYVNGSYIKGLRQIDGDYYYFNSDGSMYKGIKSFAPEASGSLFDEATTLDFSRETGKGSIVTACGFNDTADGRTYTVDGTALTGLQMIEGSYYMFDENGIAITGKLTVQPEDSNGYFREATEIAFDKTTGAGEAKILNGFVTGTDGYTRYYINNILLRGLHIIDGYAYYFSTTSGTMNKGTHSVYPVHSNGLLSGRNAVSFSFDNATGRAVYTGLNGFFRGSDKVMRYYDKGVFRTGLQLIDGKYYLFDESGTMQTGTIVIAPEDSGGLLDEEKIFNFNESTGIGTIQLKQGFITMNDGSTKYYVDDEYVTGLQLIDNEYYYFDDNGNMLKGEQIVPYNRTNGLFRDATGFVFDETTGAGTQVPLNGIALCRGDIYRYYVDGEYQKGLQIIDGYYYYFSTSSGAMVTGDRTVYPGNSNGLLTEITVIHFDEETGRGEIPLLNGFITEKNVTRYYVDGEYVKGLQLIDGKYYYFSTSSGAMRTGDYTVYPGNSNGLLKEVTSFHFDETTGAAVLEEDKPAVFSAKDGSTAVIDGDMIYGLKQKLTKSAFENDYITAENVSITYSGSGSSRYLGTGTVVTVTSEQTGEVVATYTIVIYGDVTGDGSVDANDRISLNNSISGISDPFEGAFKEAANLNGDRRVNAQDLVRLNNVLSGMSEIDQTTGLAN